jgi:hypothetical protein
MNEAVIYNLANFGFQELIEAKNIIEALIKHGLPEDFEPYGVRLEMNTNSGYVFLSNSECQTVMLNPENKLEQLIYCQECGDEGFISCSKGYNLEKSLCKYCYEKEQKEEAKNA